MGAFRGGAGRGLGVFWSRGSVQVPSERKCSGQGCGSGTTPSPGVLSPPFTISLGGHGGSSWECLSLPPCPKTSYSAPTFRFGLGPLGQSL